MRKLEFTPIPKLTSDTNFVAIEGNNVTLTCSTILANSSQMHLEFMFKEEIVKSDDNRKVLEMRENSNKAHRDLLITNAVQSRDQGDYKCIVVDQINETELTSESKTLLFVMNAFETFEKAVNDDIIVNSGDRQAKLSINYNATTDAIVYIYKPDNQLIISVDDMFSTNKDKKFTVLILNETVELTVEYPNIHDFGDYTFMVMCAGKQFKKIVRLIVNEKPNVSPENVYSRIGKPVSFKCKATGYPKPHITLGEFFIKIFENLRKSKSYKSNNFCPSLEFNLCDSVSDWPNCKTTYHRELAVDVFSELPNVSR